MKWGVQVEAREKPFHQIFSLGRKSWNGSDCASKPRRIERLLYPLPLPHEGEAGESTLANHLVLGHEEAWQSQNPLN
jgi:hypothetical protein